MNGNDFIGRGWRFPINVNARGGIDWSDGPDRISDAIWIIIKTSLGERVMRPLFGAGINDFVFQSNSSVTRTQLVAAIKSALLKWEPRIDLEQVVAEPAADEPSQVLISIQYRLRATNGLFNVVYPLYLQEGVS
ncbi:MAG: GPW/gp25 family protein [Candidatus Eremiobacteraeota bacterium]|nr:GPW/gp25 family protein [Candidatus Eremiobacteraeota bacterium]